MTHLAIAASRGMKNGLNAYLEALEKGSGIEQIAAKRAEYLALPKRKRLARYCNEFGAQVTGEQGTMRNKPRNARVVGVQVFADEQVENTLADEIAAARKRLAELEARASKPKAEPKAKQDERKPNVWHPWAVKKHNIPTTVGATFTYKGKRRTSTFKVTKVTKNGVESIRVA